MAKEERVRANARAKYRKLNYFFLNGNLHKRLHINRGADQITTWCYPLHKRVAYTYSDVKKQHERAFTTVEVCEMLQRHRNTVENAILSGNIKEPQHTYGLNEAKKRYQYMWHEDNIIELHEYLSNIHRGRPRKDGMITPAHLPTLRELRALIRQDEILYVRGDDGEFRPVWKAQEF